MELLPPTGWADVASRRDVTHLGEVIETRFARVDARFEQIDGKIESRFAQLDDTIDAQSQIAEHRLATEIAGVHASLAELRTEMHRSLRVNMLVTVGVLGTLITVVGALTGNG
jgi:hypothetical protein